MSKTKSGRHRLSKTDKRLLAALIAAGYEERTARDLIQKHVYTLTQADLRHLVSEISNGVGQSQAYDAIYPPVHSAITAAICFLSTCGET